MPTYQRGDFVKVEFADETTAIGEWMWVRVQRCDDEKRIVFGTLDNVPLNDIEGKLKPGKELAVSFDLVREHRRPRELAPPSQGQEPPRASGRGESRGRTEDRKDASEEFDSPPLRP